MSKTKPKTNIVLLYVIAIGVVVLALVGIVSIVGNMGVIGEAWSFVSPSTKATTSSIIPLQATCEPACPLGFLYLDDTCKIEKEYIPSTGVAGSNPKPVDVCKGKVTCCIAVEGTEGYDCVDGTCTLYSPKIVSLESTAVYATVFD